MLPNPQPEEKELLAFLLSQPGSLDQYVVCPSFQVGQQRSFSALSQATLPSLKDALLACAVIAKQLKAGSVLDTDMTSSVYYISKAMVTLRSMPVLSPQDAVLCQTLGGLLAFSISSAVGVGVPDICRHSLGTTTAFMETTVSDAYEDQWKNFLIVLETMNCFVHRQKPIVRIQVLYPGVVDCRLGLCLPLLPHYYDLCVISNSLLDATDMDTLVRLQKQLDDIRCIVEPWQPSQLDHLLERFDSAEFVHLLAQAKLYRLGALLMGHRLRFPFGQEDAQADIWSREIMMELEMAKRVTKRPVRFVTLPFIVAAVEARDESVRAKTLERVDHCVDHYAQFLQKATKTFLSRVWHERDLNITARWFDSINKPCPVLDSINTISFGSQ